MFWLRMFISLVFKAFRRQMWSNEIVDIFFSYRMEDLVQRTPCIIMMRRRFGFKKFTTYWAHEPCLQNGWDWCSSVGWVVDKRLSSFLDQQAMRWIRRAGISVVERAAFRTLQVHNQSNQEKTHE